MTAARTLTILLAAGLTAAAPNFAAAQTREKQATRPAEAPAPRAAQPRQQNVPQQQPRNPKAQAKNQARGDEIFMKLLKMTPDEREKALSVLPAGRRQQLEKR